MKVKKIFAIWWGEIGTWKLYQEDVDTYIDQQMLDLLGIDEPKILFIPGFGRSPGYNEKFTSYFKKHFWIVVVVIEDIYSKTGNSSLERESTEADLIYIGWGDTVWMISSFREHGNDILLKKLYDQWVMMAGVSAWAICWFEYGVSDSHPTQKPYGQIKWLWFLDWICCPHYGNEEWRKEFFALSYFDLHTTWYGIPDSTALYFENWVPKRIGRDITEIFITTPLR